ncbi:NCS2 family permease [bacterium]|nr:NCS2 family permease [bacterium]
MLDNFFKLKEHGTNVRTEVLAGTTTFMTMAYIIFFQPALFSVTMGMDHGAVMMATCISAAVATLMMGLWANYPIALAPGMGENFFFVSVVTTTAIAFGGIRVTWQMALAAVFISGMLFTLLTFLRVREMIINAIPPSIKHAIAAGIGAFIAFIGLKYCGIVEQNPDALVRLGNMRSPITLLSIIGLLIICLLMVRRIRGGIVIGMILTAVIGALVGLKFKGLDGSLHAVVAYEGVMSLKPPDVSPTFLKLDWAAMIRWEMISVIILFLFMDMLDTVGTLVGVSERAGLMKEGKLPRANRAFLSDAVGTSVGALLGTSTVTSYIESVAGVSEGGRTGLSSVATAFLFLAAMFFYPLVKTIGGGCQIAPTVTLYPVIGPALIVVGAMMMRSVAKIKWDDFSEAVPSFLIFLGIPLTYSIADGFAFGFISYPILKLFSGKAKEINWLLYLLAALFILRYALL